MKITFGNPSWSYQNLGPIFTSLSESFSLNKAFIVDEKNDLPGMGREDQGLHTTITVSFGSAS